MSTAVRSYSRHRNSVGPSTVRPAAERSRRGGSIFESRLFCCLILLVLVKPEYFGQLYALNRLYLYVSFLVTIVFFLLVVIENRLDFTIFWIALFYGVGLAATMLGSGEVYAFCQSNFNALAMCLVTALWLERSPETFLKSSQILQLFVYINLLTILLYPDGLYTSDLYTKNWFLGYKNIQVRTILPIIALSMMYSYWKRGKLTLQSYALIACSCVTFLLIDSSTSLVGMAIFLVLVFLFHSREKRIPRFINLATCFAAIMLICAGIYLFSIQNYLAFFIEDVLQRSLDFTTRTRIWKVAMTMVETKPWLGWGWLTSAQYVSMFGFIHATHPHSYVLYVLCTGGIALFLTVVAGILYASRKLSANMESVYPKILLALLVAFFIMGIDEALTANVMLYPSLIMAMKVERLVAMGYCEGKVRPEPAPAEDTVEAVPPTRRYRRSRATHGAW